MQKFLIKISFFVLPFVIIFVLFVYVVNNSTGDIGKLGMIPFGNYDVVCNLPAKNCVISCYCVDDLKDAEIVSIGDSFNKVGGEGCFLNYLGNELNCNVYRLQLSLSNYRLLDSLLNSNAMPNCKVLLIESVERALISRLDSYSEENLKFDDFDRKDNNTNSWISNITLENYFSFIRLSLKCDNPITSVRLYDQFFTCKGYENVLYFYNSKNYSDLGFEELSDNQYLQALKNLYCIKSKVNSKGILMMFICAADKYDMYYDYIVDNPYGKNPTLDYFLDVDSTFFVNTKSILKPYLDKGQKDVYLANDTHWSPIAAEIVGKHIAGIIESKVYLK